jgi:serine/threonine-protein kinase
MPGSDYEAIKLIGSGAHALVRLARDRSNGELCAVKEFLAGGKAGQYFFRELSSLFTLQHPNIIRCLNLVYGQGTERDKLILEYASGGSLRDLLNERTSVEPTEALTILRDVVAGLAHAHANQILHRDLKPENILICVDEATGTRTYKVADLGIANHLANIHDIQNPNGSPAYMAPEQFYDFSTYASDLYSLGVILFELLTGDRPFTGAPEQLFVAHAKETPDFNLITDPGCRRLVEALLAKQPGDRPKSARDLALWIDALLTQSVTPRGIPLVAFKAEGAPTRTEITHSCSLEFDFAKVIPGSRRLFAPIPGHLGTVFIADDRATGTLDLERGRFFPHFLSERMTAVAVQHADSNNGFFATNYGLYRLSADDLSPRRLFSPRMDVAALAVSSSGESIACVDATHLCCFDPNGRRLWESECRNYFLRPQVLMLESGEILVSSGPTPPLVQGFDTKGTSVLNVRLDSPVLALGRAPVPAEFQVVAFGGEPGESIRIISYRHDEPLTEVHLFGTAYEAHAYAHFITVFHPSNRVTFVAGGHVICEYEAEGTIVDDCWIPAANAYITIEKISGQTVVKVFRLIEEHSKIP